MKKLFSLLVVLFATLTLFGCGPKDENTQPEMKKILRVIETSNIPDLTSWTSTDQVSFLMLGNVMEGLYVLHENGNPVLGMAAAEPTVEEKQVGDATHYVYTFTLRDQVWTKHDGTAYQENGQDVKVTANDFVFAWKKLADPESASQYATFLATVGLAGFEELNDLPADAPRADVEAALNNLGIKAIDAKTLEIEIVNPVPYLNALLTFPSLYPVHENFYTTAGDDYAKTVDKLLYNGAFTFSYWKTSQWHILNKNPLYWDAANVKLDQVVFPVRVGVDNNTVVTMYLNGQIDSVGLSGTNVEKYGSRPDRRIGTSPTVFYLEVNQGYKDSENEFRAVEVMSDVDARKAIALSIDKSYITDAIFNNGSYPADYLVPAKFVNMPIDDTGTVVDFRDGMTQYYSNDTFPTYELPKGAGSAPAGYLHYDVDTAKTLWAGVAQRHNITASNPLEISCIIYDGPVALAVGQHIKSEVEKNLSNVTIKLEVLPFNVKLDRVERGDFQLNWAGWGPDYPDPLTFLELFTTDSGFNTYGYANAQYDQLLLDSRDGTLTGYERTQALIQAERILIEQDVAVIPLYQRNSVGLRNPNVQQLWSQSFGPDFIFKWVDKPAEPVVK